MVICWIAAGYIIPFTDTIDALNKTKLNKIKLNKTTATAKTAAVVGNIDVAAGSTLSSPSRMDH